jgi:hypothetical protein
MNKPFNWSVNTDPQLQEAASPQLLRSGHLQRLRVCKKEKGVILFSVRIAAP